MILNDQPDTSNETKKTLIPLDVEISLNIQQHKSFKSFLVIVLILSISSFEFGYALCEISTVSITSLLQIFRLNMKQGLANGILVGIMPVGGIFGCLLNKLFLKWFSKKNCHFVVSIFNVISTILNQLRYPQTIIIGRFILGICCGIYTGIAPLYVKEISPFKKRVLFGSFFSLGRIIGIVFCYSLGLILLLSGAPNYWRVMFAIPGFLAILQSGLIFFFVPDSPVQMFKNQRMDEFNQFIEKYYEPQSVQYIKKEYRIQIQLQKKSSSQANQVKQDDPLAPNKQRAFIMSIHLNIYRQMIGVNTIVAFAGQMISVIDPSIGIYINTIINGIQLIATIISTFWLGNKFGRRPLYLSSGIIFALSSFLVAIGYLVKVNALIVIFMIVYMIFFGLLFAPVSWSYPPEIVPASQSAIAVVFTWVALAFTTIIPPIIMQEMNQDAYPIFLFFGVYTTISIIYMWGALVQSKGLKYKEIIQKY